MQVAGALLGEVRTQVGMLDRIGDSTTGANDMLKSSLAKFNKVRATWDVNILDSIWLKLQTDIRTQTDIQRDTFAHPNPQVYRPVRRGCQTHVHLHGAVHRVAELILFRVLPPTHMCLLAGVFQL